MSKIDKNEDSPRKRYVKILGLRVALGGCSDSTVWRLTKDPDADFPKGFQILLGGQKLWDLDEIEDWIESRRAMNLQPKPQPIIGEGKKRGRPRKVENAISCKSIHIPPEAHFLKPLKPTSDEPSTAKVLTYGFDVFYKAYPRKVGKEAAVKAFAKSKANAVIAIILADIDRRLISGEWTTEKERYIPHPATYLNGRRWEDESNTVEAAAPWAGAR